MTGHHPPAEAGEPPRVFRRELDVEELLAIERATSVVVEPVARMWRELTLTADRALTPRSLDAVLRDALSTIGRLLSVHSVAILLANEAGDELVARAAIGLSEELSISPGIRAGEGMSGQVLMNRKPLVIGDLSTIHVVNPVLRDSGLRSVVAVPMLSEGHRLGVMWAGSYERDRFTLADADLLQVVANRLAAALDRVRVFERERAARREAEALADRIARIQRATAELAATHSPGDIASAVVRSLESEPPPWCAVWTLREDRAELLARSGDPPPDWEVAVGGRTPPSRTRCAQALPRSASRATAAAERAAGRLCRSSPGRVRSQPSRSSLRAAIGSPPRNGRSSRSSSGRPDRRSSAPSSPPPNGRPRTGHRSSRARHKCSRRPTTSPRRSSDLGLWRLRRSLRSASSMSSARTGRSQEWWPGTAIPRSSRSSTGCAPSSRPTPKGNIRPFGRSPRGKPPGPRTCPKSSCAPPR